MLSQYFASRCWRTLPRIELRPIVFVGIAVGILVIPLRYIISWLIAAAVHELFHLFALYLVREPVYAVEIDMLGARIKTGPIQPWKECVCSVAGPLGSFLLLFISRWFPLIALCGCVQGICNMIPLYQMDGGRAVRCFLSLLIPDNLAHSISVILHFFVSSTVSILGLYCWLRLSLGPLPFLLATALTLKEIKIPCKTNIKKVQ